MGDPRYTPPLGTTEPGAFDLPDRAYKKFEELLGSAKSLAPELPLPLQKGIAILDKEHKQRNQSLFGPPDPDPNVPPNVARFTMGPPRAPAVDFDHGFLDRLVNGKHTLDETKRQPPTSKDYFRRALWEDAAWCALMVRPDLIDGVLGYLHFLHGNGTPFRLNYGRFIGTDVCGRRVLDSATEDTRQAAMAFGQVLATIEMTTWKRSFEMYSDAVVVDDSWRYPYPATENWQKAIGAHAIWIGAKVDMALDPSRNTVQYDVAMTIHALDMYNFNPDNHDIGTGIADAENGRFEITGLGHEFVQSGDVTRPLTFVTILPPSVPRPLGGP